MTIRQVFSLIIFFFSTAFIWSDTLYDATLLERSDRIGEAVVLYDEWLSENTDDERFTEILLHSASLIPSVEKTIQFLFKFENNIKSNGRQRYYLRLAQTYELLFRLEEASIYYGIASINPDGNRDYRIYLKYLQLKYQMGVIPDIAELNKILLSDIPEGVQVDALIFKSEIFKYRGDLRSAESILLQSEYKNNFPELYFALWELYSLYNDYTKMQKIVKILKSEFSDSVELSIIEGRIDQLPRLSNLFIERKTEIKLSYIQIGTFENPENVHSQSELLNSMGFDYFFIEEGKSTRIIVTGNTTPDHLLSELRSSGFDGFRIDYP